LLCVETGVAKLRRAALIDPKAFRLRRPWERLRANRRDAIGSYVDKEMVWRNEELQLMIASVKEVLGMYQSLKIYRA
jgi:hypothetical protein